MREFKVGDKVKVTHSDIVSLDNIGTIYEISGDVALIQWKDKVKGSHSGGYSRDYSRPNSWNVKIEYLKLAEDVSTQSEFSARTLIEVTIKGNTFQLTLDEAYELRESLEGVI